MDRSIRERAGLLFGALANPTRLRIVELLCEGERAVNDVAAALNLPQSGTSQHLAVLTRAGLLVVEPHGASRIYRVRGPRIKQILKLIEEFCALHSLYGADEDPAEDVAGFSSLKPVADATPEETNEVRR